VWHFVFFKKCGYTHVACHLLYWSDKSALIQSKFVKRAKIAKGLILRGLNFSFFKGAKITTLTNLGGQNCSLAKNNMTKLIDKDLNQRQLIRKTCTLCNDPNFWMLISKVFSAKTNNFFFKIISIMLNSSTQL